MNTVLVIWTVVALSQAYTRETLVEYDWRPVGVFKSIDACHKAAALLGKEATKYRCLPGAA